MDRVMSALAARSSMPEVCVLAAVWTAWRARLAGERGMTTETVIITAGLSALAVAVVAIIVSRVTQRANAIR